jgi:hypothetical protein
MNSLNLYAFSLLSLFSHLSLPSYLFILITLFIFLLLRFHLFHTLTHTHRFLFLFHSFHSFHSFPVSFSFFEEEPKEEVTSNTTTLTKKTNKKSLRIRKHHTKVYENYNTIKQFMSPHTNFSLDITTKTFETIKEIISFENEITQFDPLPPDSQLFNLLYNINTLHNKVCTTTVNHHSPMTNIQERIDSLIELERNTNYYFGCVSRLIHSHRNFASSMLNKDNYTWKKKFTQNTILLNTDTMLSYLNNDTMNHIKSFIDPNMLESIRIHFIRAKRLPYPKQQITNYLHSFTLSQLHHIYRS